MSIRPICAVFAAEVDTTPGAGRVHVGLVNSKAIAHVGFSFNVNTNGQTVVERCFAGEVHFCIAQDVDVTLVNAEVAILGRVSHIATEIATE